MKARALQLDNWGRKMTWVALAGVVVCASLYVYFLSDSVFNTTQRREKFEEIAFLEATVAVLESEYLTKLSLINLEYAKSLGFVDSVGSTTYATLDLSAVSMIPLGDEI